MKRRLCPFLKLATWNLCSLYGGCAMTVAMKVNLKRILQITLKKKKTYLVHLLTQKRIYKNSMYELISFILSIFKKC